ncbi:MAG: hypothetical protein Aurels2KO_28670 [Aureliella sp.]
MNVLTALALVFAAGQVNPTGALPAQPPFQSGDTRPTLPSNQSLPSSLPNSSTGTFPQRNPPSSSLPSSSLPQGSPLSGSTSGNSLPQRGSQNLPSSRSQRDQTLAHLSPERTFGWDYDENAELYYIHQISPAHAKQMLQELEMGKDLIYANSTMPKELVGRIRKITVQIGTEILPRNPSLEQLNSIARLDRSEVEAQLDRLGRGSIARVEPDGQAMPVQLPGSGPSFGPSQQRLGDSSTPAPGSQFLNDAGGSTALPDYGDYNNGPTPPPTTQADPNYDRMAALPTSTPGRGDRYQQGNGQANSLRGGYDGRTAPYSDPPTLTPNNNPTGFGNQPQVPSFGQGGLAAAGDRTLNNRDNQLAADYNNPNYQAQNQRTPDYTNQSGALTSGGYPNGMRDLQNQPAYASTAQPNSSSQQPYDYERIASRNQASPALPSTAPSAAAKFAQQQDSLSPSDLKREIEAAAAEAKEEGREEAKKEVAAKTATIQNQNNLIGLFCVLSLVVNCYLFMLIRKLLTRYRTLLTNVRSQAA